MNKTIRIWTWKYEPFKMGGPLHDAVCTYAEPNMEIQVGGYTLCSFQNPKTKHWHIAEKSSGGIVGAGDREGTAFAMVIQDIGQGDPDMMETQVKEAMQTGAGASVMNPEDFWKMRFK